MFLQQIKMIVLNIMGLIRRALCCFNKRRKLSYSEPMTNIVIIDSNYNNSTNNKTKALNCDNNSKNSVERDWNSWDDNPRTVQEHIEQYRQQVAKPSTPLPEALEPDYFKELAPVIQPQPKFYMDNNDNNLSKANFSRLEAKTDVPIALNADLEDWIENDTNDGWEEVDTKEATQLIREQRRQKRYNNNNSSNRSKITQNVTNTLNDDAMNFMINNNNVYTIKQLS